MSASKHLTAAPSQSLAYFLAIDGPLFRTQREALGKLVARAGPAELEPLLGIQNLLDAIADQAHDRHGIDCLFVAPDDRDPT